MSRQHQNRVLCSAEQIITGPPAAITPGLRRSLLGRSLGARPRRQCCGAVKRNECPGGTPTRPKRVLTFQDAETGIEVVLVGTMHYNPASIADAVRCVSEAAEDGVLASLVIESCPERWALTNKLQKPGSLLRAVLDNEFQAAAEAAGDSCQLVLGDQRVEELGGVLSVLFKETLADLAAPAAGGWTRIADDLVRCASNDIAGVPGKGLGPWDLLDPLLWASAPVSFVRYPLAWMIKAPGTVIPLLAFLCGLGLLPGLLIGSPAGAEAAAVDPLAHQAAEDAVTGVFAVLDVLELVVLPRLFLVALLERRNGILAESIRDACKEAEPGKKVVAILGAAHLNGVQGRLLQAGVA